MTRRLTGNSTYLWYCMRIEHQPICLEYPPLFSCLGDNPNSIDLTCPTAFDKDSYADHERAKFAKLRDVVESKLVSAVEYQKKTYDQRYASETFHTGNTVWLSWPSAGKPDSRWEGNWTVKAIKSPCNVEITDGHCTIGVHVNRLRHRVQPTTTTATSMSDEG